MTDIKFGTDGWRAVLGKDFTVDNVDKVINAIGIYTYKNNKFNRKILISYDPRNKADEFAFYIAKSLANFGFDVEIADKITATPVLAYSALMKNAYAIMLTASHNPPEYLGIKFIPEYGGPAEDATVKEIVANLDSEFNVTSEPKSYKIVSFDEDYINHIKNIIDLNKIAQSEITINYDGHHGACAKLFKRILDEAGITNTCFNMDRDINFGGFMPDPKEKYLPKLKQECLETGIIGLSNDGDGDRFGAFNEKGEFVSANEIIAILLKHIIKNKGLSGKLAKTVGASSMLDIAAKNLSVDVIETPVGFKWLGSAMRNDDVIIAGEESGGLSIKGHIPEKDGIIANLLIMEAMVYQHKKLFELQDDLKKEIDRDFINERVDIELTSREEQDKIIEKFKSYSSIGQYKITKRNTIDGLKLYLNDESSILIRKSGTEPLLRIYFETDTKEKAEELKTIVKQMV